MVDVLTELLRAEADGLDVPPPPTAAIVRDGRRARRVRRVVPGIAAVAAASVVAAFALLPGTGSGDPTVGRSDRSPAAFTSAEAAAAEEAYAESGAYAVGSEIFFGDLEQGVEIDDPAVRGLYYTSAGLLVRHGKDHVMDGPRGEGYSLVGTDGSVAGLDISLGDVSPSTDPTQPYLAYARAAATDWEVVVLDLRTGGPAAVVPVEGSFTWGGWDAPPVALSGDRVYVGLDDAVVAVDWRSGEIATTPLAGSRYPDVNADRSLQIDNAVSARTGVQVQDALTGEVLLDLPDVGDRWASLSPDGSHVLVLPYMPVDDEGQIGMLAGAVLYSVDSGRSTEIPASPTGGYGWTPDGSVISVAGAELTRCDLAGCDSSAIDPEAVGSGTVRLGGMVNEA